MSGGNYSMSAPTCWSAVGKTLLLLNDAHYKSDCILLAIFREILNKSYFKLLAYVPTLPRLLALHKTLQRFLWNIVNITKIQEHCSAAWCVCCTSDAGIALTPSRGTRQVARVSSTAKSYHFVSIFHICIDVSYRTQNIAMHRYIDVSFHPHHLPGQNFLLTIGSVPIRVFNLCPSHSSTVIIACLSWLDQKSATRMPKPN